MKGSMIERVAKAIDDQMASDDNAPEDIARAAITATRDPTEEILKVGILHSSGGVLCSWQAMIDECLK